MQYGIDWQRAVAMQGTWHGLVDNMVSDMTICANNNTWPEGRATQCQRIVALRSSHFTTRPPMSYQTQTIDTQLMGALS